MSYENYTDWKGWNAAKFGSYDPDEASFYEAEFTPLVTAIEGASFVEIGFGQGPFLGWARSRGVRIAGVELQDEMLEAARQKGFEVYPTIGDLAGHGRSYEVVVAMDVFEHLTAGQLTDLLRQCRQFVSQDSGLLWARFPNGDSPFSLPIQNGDPTHISAWGAGAIQNVCRQAGWEIVELRGVKLAGATLKKRMIRRVKRYLRSIMDRCVFSLYLGSARPSTLEQNYVLIARPSKSR